MKYPELHPMDRVPWSLLLLLQRLQASLSPTFTLSWWEMFWVTQFSFSHAFAMSLLWGLAYLCLCCEKQLLSHDFWYSWARLITVGKIQLCFLFGLDSYTKLFVLLRIRKAIVKEKFTLTHTHRLNLQWAEAAAWLQISGRYFAHTTCN